MPLGMDALGRILVVVFTWRGDVARLILAILLPEDDAAAYRARIADAGYALVSAVSAVELAAVASRDDALSDAVRAFLEEPFVVVETVDAAQASAAAAAWRRFGRGRHPAGLNPGDVFPCALARTRGLPLLFEGRDFSRTDVECAVPSET